MLVFAEKISFFYCSKKNRINIKLEGHKLKLTCLAEITNKRLASGSFELSIIIWDIKEWKSIATLIDHKKPIHSLLMLQDNRLVSAAAYMGYIRVWNVNTFEF